MQCYFKIDYFLIGFIGFKRYCWKKKEKENETEEDKSKEQAKKKKAAIDSLKFFKEITAHIEIMREGKFIKIFFPILPKC